MDSVSSPAVCDDALARELEGATDDTIELELGAVAGGVDPELGVAEVS